MTIFKTEVDVETINKRAQNSLSDHLGILFTEVGQDFVCATMPINEKTTQPMGIMHGGASAALAETVGSAAANFCIDQNEFVCVGLEINVNHLKPVSKGKVKAVAKPYHLGRKTHVWEIKLFNDDNKLVSISRLTLAVISKAEIKK